MSVAIISRLAVAIALVQTATSKEARPFPEAGPFLEAVRMNLARSQDAQNLFAYKERRTDLNLNPFGRLGTDDRGGRGRTDTSTSASRSTRGPASRAPGPPGAAPLTSRRAA